LIYNALKDIYGQGFEDEKESQLAIDVTVKGKKYGGYLPRA